jgi:hypothetical protein
MAKNGEDINQTKKLGPLASAIAAGGHTSKPFKVEQPVEKYFLVGDTTAEKLHEMNELVPEGMVVIREEMGGFLEGMQAKGRDHIERPYYLTAWNGFSSYSMHRIGRGSVYVKRICVTFIGTIQPAKLAAWARTIDPTTDGFIFRFQLFVYPDRKPKRQCVDRKPDAAAAARIDKLFRCLLRLKEDALTARFDEDAQGTWDDWLCDLEENQLTDPDESTIMIDHLEKFPSLFASLALLFQLAEIGGADDFDGFEPLVGKTVMVGRESTLRAWMWCRYLESHARRIYSLFGKRETNAAGVLCERIKARQIGASGPASPRTRHRRH